MTSLLILIFTVIIGAVIYAFGYAAELAFDRFMDFREERIKKLQGR